MSDRKLPRTSHWIAALLAMSCAFFIFSPHLVAEDLSADEILKKSAEAMKPPIQYRIHTAETDMRVSQKMMPDGTIASRTESTKPVPKISLMLGKENYDAYPTHGIAIDTQLIFQGAKDQAAAAFAAIKLPPANSAKVKGTVAREGRECYEIETRIATELIDALSQSLPDNFRKQMPAGNRFLIDKESFQMVEMQTMVQDGSVSQQMAFKDIVTQPDLSDDLFLLPLGMEVKQPKTIHEYSRMVSDIILADIDASVRPRLPLLVPKPLKLPTDRPPPLGPIKIDVNTGLAIPPVPPGMTQLEFDILTTPPKPVPKVYPTRSGTMILFMLSPVVAVCAFLGRQRWKAFRESR